jgi:hypothetical protein
MYKQVTEVQFYYTSEYIFQAFTFQEVSTSQISLEILFRLFRLISTSSLNYVR